ncbi:unnamed protein product [Rotaria socialis]|uniref:Uncharacterized protein n=1 Tax=Rotaria socialis TaxID=392032 RepID=A0A821E8I3_9BILA|nr:unnamed protein product [Rotaria socialis]CAF4632662.1 unnamed protein product [Rotaria socialis]
MDSNSTQPGNIPSEPTLNNDESETSIDQLAYTRIVNLSQSSTIHMHTGDMIPTQMETNTRNRIPIQLHTTSYWLMTERRANTGNRIPGQIQTNTTEKQEAILSRRLESRRQYRQRRAQMRREQRAIEQAQRHNHELKSDENNELFNNHYDNNDNQDNNYNNDYNDNNDNNDNNDYNDNNDNNDNNDSNNINDINNLDNINEAEANKEDKNAVRDGCNGSSKNNNI